MKLEQKLLRFPPILLRLLASKGCKPLTTGEISERSGLSPAMVEALSQTLSWDSVTVEQFQKFQKGCQLNLDNRSQIKRVLVYLAGRKLPSGQRKPPTFRYLRKDPNWEGYYLPLMKRWVNHVQQTQMSPRP